MELTSLQLYSVALSAGKAHRDHKHHHVHKFDHQGEISTTTPAPRPAVSLCYHKKSQKIYLLIFSSLKIQIIANQVANPLLANGQFPSRVRINLAQVQQPAAPQQPLPTINTNFVRGQFNAGARNLQTQLLTGNYLQQLQSQGQFSPSPAPILPTASPSSGSIRFPSSQPQQPLQPQQPSNDGAFSFSSTFTEFSGNSPDIEIIDQSELPNIRFKRQSEKSKKTSTKSSDEEKKSKRGLVELTDGTIVDDQFFDTDWYDGLAQFGGNELKSSLTKHDTLEEEIKEHDREPAEGEVEAVRSYCNSCLIEPFESALVLPWKSASASHGVLRAKASKVCGDF